MSDHDSAAQRALPELIAQLRHLYRNLVEGGVRDTASAKRIATGLLGPVIEQLERKPEPVGPWKCGNEFLPYHPSASHVEPGYRDGWNACYLAAAPKADERGSAEPVAMYQAFRAWQWKAQSIHPWDAYQAGAQFTHPDSAQARDAAQAVELTDDEIACFLNEIPDPVEFVTPYFAIARAIERAVLAKNGIGGKQ